MTKHLSVLSLFALLVPFAAGCGARAQAKTTPDGPPLDMPAPPPRDVEAGGAEAPAAVAPSQEPARNAPARPRPAPPPAPAPTREPAAEVAKPADEPPRAPATLQTKPAGAESDAERGIRATLTHANTDLSHVDYQKLNADARSQYDYAKRFMRQAEDALSAKNLVFAKTVADKAAALAAQLAGR